MKNNIINKTVKALDEYQRAIYKRLPNFYIELKRKKYNKLHKKIIEKGLDGNFREASGLYL